MLHLPTIARKIMAHSLQGNQEAATFVLHYNLCFLELSMEFYISG